MLKPSKDDFGTVLYIGGHFLAFSFIFYIPTLTTDELVHTQPTNNHTCPAEKQSHSTHHHAGFDCFNRLYY